MSEYDAILVVSFGGPEGPDDVMPFLENVVRGRNVPTERLEAVAEHYHHFGGVSPIQARTRELIRALEAELAAHGPKLPIYWGNRHWRPTLEDTLRKMASDGRKRALAFVTSALSSYSGCRAYREDIARDRAAVGESAPTVDKVRAFFDHPLYLDVWRERLEEALRGVPAEEAHVFFTAHSIPTSMARSCDYEAQLEELAELLVDALGLASWEIAYQSRSGPPQIPWLEPDIGDALKKLASEKPGAHAVVAPIGFVCDHMEVVWDLDEEARELAASLGLGFTRALAPNDHPTFVRMAAELIRERVEARPERLSLSRWGARPDTCPADCCPAGAGRPRATES